MLRIAEISGPLELSLQGEVDIATARELAAALDRVCRQPADVVLDLSALSFMDSTGLATLIRAAALRSRFGRLVLRSPQAGVRRLFELTKLGDVPNIAILDPEDVPAP